MIYLKLFENFTRHKDWENPDENDNIFEIIFMSFLDISDKYNFEKVDDVNKSYINGTIYEIKYSKKREEYNLRIFFIDNLEGVSDDGRNLKKDLISDFHNFISHLESFGLKCIMTTESGSLILDFYISKTENISFFN